MFVMRMLHFTLNTRVEELGLKLGELESVLPELRFFYKEDCKEDGKSYMTGSADLVFMHEGEYYILDWKTNVSRGGYSKEEMAAIMEEHDYNRQALLYKTFVDKWLEYSEAGERTSGVFYVFVRPAEQQKDAAVYAVPAERLAK